VEFLLEGDAGERDVLFVEGRDPETGDVLWSDRIYDDQPREVALDGSRLIVADVSWRVLVYDVLGGERIVEEPALPEPKGRCMWGAAAHRGRYFLVGAFFGTTDWDNLDWGVRGYSLRRPRASRPKLWRGNLQWNASLAFRDLPERFDRTIETDATKDRTPHRRAVVHETRPIKLAATRRRVGGRAQLRQRSLSRRHAGAAGENVKKLLTAAA
jgi:hypothetical protein